jgi:meso-butanediol dehydrogenase/(S,S)-butanediol dehydrogenase/diacetyl reductase
MNPDGKVAIITGSGGKGTGRAVARRFAQEGMAVVVSDTDAMAVEILAPMRSTLAAIEAMRRRVGGPLRPTIQDWFA